MDFVPSQEDLIGVINAEIGLMQAAAEEGYVKLGRGCLCIEFLNRGEWSMAVLYRTLEQLPASGCPTELLSDIGELIGTYDPDREGAFILIRSPEVICTGILDFFAGVQATER